MKFGGVALKTLCHLVAAANIIVEKRETYPSIVVVVSAMDKMTDELMELARQISSCPPRREQDMLISVGERISMALLAMALKEKKQVAMSLTGSQSGIITCHRHAEARIQAVHPERIIDGLSEGKIVIVAGFQGMSTRREITTLGRGGSDTTAVALAVALGASKVEFYKDVAGVYSEDPQKNARARLFSKLSYDKALSIAKQNDFVLHLRAILLASKNQIPLHVLTFKREQGRSFPGTLITAEKPQTRGEKRYEVDDEKAESDCAVFC
ncbi:MAG: aspartate kinase [Chlamydiota bacterium]